MQVPAQPLCVQQTLWMLSWAIQASFLCAIFSTQDLSSQIPSPVPLLCHHELESGPV